MQDQGKDSLFRQHAEICKMFANPKRLKILNLLRNGEKSVSSISQETDISQPTVSQHLRKMQNQGVVTKREEGSKRYYSISDERIVEAMEIMRRVLVDQVETASKESGN